MLFERALPCPRGTIVRREPLSRADRGQRAPAHGGHPPSGGRVGRRLPRGRRWAREHPGGVAGDSHRPHPGQRALHPSPLVCITPAIWRRHPQKAHLGCFTCELQELCETGGRRTGQPRGCVTRQVDHVTSDTTGHNSCYPRRVPPKQASSARWPGNCRSYARGRVGTSGAPTGRWAGSTLPNCAG